MLANIGDKLLAGRAEGADYGRLFIDVLDHFLDQCDSGELVLRIAPCVRQPLPDSKRAGLHHVPEIFFQLQGLTHFVTPGKTFRLMPGQVAIMPPLVAHEERAMRWAGSEFANLVVMLGGDYVSLHLARAGADGFPAGAMRRLYSPRRQGKIVSYLDDVIDADVGESAASDQTGRGAMMAALGHIRATLDHGILSSGREHAKIAMCKSISMTHLSNPALNVRELARRIGCSADYLSNLFHKNTGVRLTAWLTEQRIERVCQLLRESTMNISEIAWATGFSDPAYLARCFRAATGLTPRDYRARHIAAGG